ncbi:hypothetical protein RCZ01_06430 [Capnocytophaga felis]|uniref:Uncharacterized protein n=1 Tax=Capnocytophaga felis TaxID=2267611 RepID=A0A5M4B6V8_9FLAO|nr:hypothetical protein RCZ01_06430 [Capnocytophaga felis]GET47496.1 hypothetical protein RCZ02_03270 [Capnocytophaga felis]
MGKSMVQANTERPMMAFVVPILSSALTSPDDFKTLNIAMFINEATTPMLKIVKISLAPTHCLPKTIDMISFE